MTLLFVAGSHTDVGKTHVACALLRAARAGGRRADAFKPVLSGYDPSDPGASDAGRLLAALGRPLTEAQIEAVAPLRFEAPLAPPLAARRQGLRLSRAGLVRLSTEWIAQSSGDLGLVEGAGGVMSPIADDATNLDLIDDLGLPVLLVGGAYLGAVSHTLTALEVLRSRGASVAAVVLSASADPHAPDFMETVELTRDFAGMVPVIPAPRAPSDPWEHELLEAVLHRPAVGARTRRRPAEPSLTGAS